ncbi:MAG: hypothetical protein IT165_14370 [Bryobacterales bacterium]|nr:hypothetical protein [Bryobacterales bacterium]
MAETLQKLRPDRDLQCYFFRPSAVAAISEASSQGFVVSGTWRQQADWAVVEWNRDNVFEHPAMRNLPNGDLSQLVLSYEETRTNCIPLDSDLYPTVEWPHLRVWSGSSGNESLYYVRLKDYSTPVAGSYVCASATFQLLGILAPGDYVGLTWLQEQYNHQVTTSDTIATASQALVDAINSLSTTVHAEISGTAIVLHYVGPNENLQTSTTGANGNRLGAYGFVSGSGAGRWQPAAQAFSGGASPARWRTTLDFSNLHDITGSLVPMTSVRKMRWTYAANLQPGHFQRSEFEVRVSGWQVIGAGVDYSVAGPGSWRIEDSDGEMTYTGIWDADRGNFSGGTIHYTTAPNASASVTFHLSTSMSLYAGVRYAFSACRISAAIDGGLPVYYELRVAGEDALARIFLGNVSSGQHTVVLSHAGEAGEYFYLDFFELAALTQVLPMFPAQTKYTLATDWDTDHSISLAPERAAWMLYSLGFRGRVNHYAGALWFYELVAQGHTYASATVTFNGIPAFSQPVSISIGRAGDPPANSTVFSHLVLIGDTANTIAKAFEFLINNGSTGVWAESAGNVLTVHSRSMGADGNSYTIAATPSSGSFTAVVSGNQFSGGVNGVWLTDLTAMPRINRAVRDWTRSYFAALNSYGLQGTAAFSMELQHGDPSVAAGIAQRYPSGQPVLLNTPALQTNFSPASIAFWQQVYLDMAKVMNDAQVTPYLQFGEVQWWYFPYDASGLPFHDEYTKTQFQNQFGFAIRVVPDGSADPAQYPEEAAFLPGLIGAFTTQVASFVKAQYPNCRFEVLYPTDVNEGAFNRVINYPSTWNSTNLDNIKTESFTYTLNRNLDKCLVSMQFPKDKGFPLPQRSHLVGISDPTSPWLKEASLARGEGVESVVLFALDQFCLVGYPLPLKEVNGRSAKFGS